MCQRLWPQIFWYILSNCKSLCLRNIVTSTYFVPIKVLIMEVSQKKFSSYCYFEMPFLIFRLSAFHFTKLSSIYLFIDLSYLRSEILPCIYSGCESITCLILQLFMKMYFMYIKIILNRFLNRSYIYLLILCTEFLPRLISFIVKS